MDITDLVLAIASAIISLAVPFGLALLRKHTSIIVQESDRKALDAMLRRAIAQAVERHAGPDRKITVHVKSQIGKAALRYAVEHSPKLVERVTGAASGKLEGRIQAQLANDFPDLTERNSP